MSVPIPDDVADMLAVRDPAADEVVVDGLGVLLWCGVRLFVESGPDRHWTVWRLKSALRLWGLEWPFEPGAAELFPVVARTERVAVYERSTEDLS